MPNIYSGEPEALKSERRKKILPLEKFESSVLNILKYRDNAVDYGAGIGYFTIPIAKHFKRVFAVDSNPEMVRKLKEELENHSVRNVGIIVSNVYPEFDFEVDFVLFSNVLHEVDNYLEILDRASKAKVVCVIDWKKIETEFGPPLNERIDRNEMISTLKKYWKHIKELEIFPYHYTLIGYNEEDALNEPDYETKDSS